MTPQQQRLAALEGKPGIKAQHAIFRALKTYLQQVQTGWDVEETTPGSVQDRDGIDIYLVNLSTHETRPLDISFREKPDAPYAVRIRNDWFEVSDEGDWTFRRECLTALCRAILPALSAPPIQRKPF